MSDSSSMSEADQAVIEELEAKHGEGTLVYVKTPKGLLVLRCPNQGEMQRLSDKMSDPKKSDFSAQKEFVLSILAHPNRDEAVSIFERYSGLIPRLTDAAFEVGGGAFEIQVGKP